MTVMFAMLLLGALILGPLGSRIWLDARQATADAITAEMRALMNRRLGGDSFVTVLTSPRSRWRAGRIVLSAPAGYEYLVESVWREVVSHAPAGYEVVFGARDPRVAIHDRRAGVRTLPRAA